MIDNLIYNIPKWYVVVFFKWFFPVIGGLFLLALKAYYSGSKTFRERIHAELKGVYPSIELYLSTDEINTKIWQSIPPIQAAVSNFKYILPFFYRRKFEIAAHNYYKTARETNWYHSLDFPSMKNISKISPKDKFKHAVDNLLKYAK